VRASNRIAVVTLASLFTSIGCIRNTFSSERSIRDEKIKIGFIVKQPEEPWFQLEWKFADQAAKDNDFELIKIGATDGEKTLTAINSLAATGAQGFIICTPEVKLGPAIVREANQLGLKMMSVDDQLLSADGSPLTKVHHLGISARKIGNQVGHELYKEMRRRNWSTSNTAVAAVTFDELATSHDRTDGAHEALVASGMPASSFFDAPTKTLDLPGAFDAVNILLTKHPDVRNWLIYSTNDSTVLGAVRATEGNGKNPTNVIAIGINGTDAISEFKKARPTAFYGSMLLSAKEHGYKTAESMYHWIKDGLEPPLDTRTVGLLITRDSYVSVLKNQGIM